MMIFFFGIYSAATASVEGKMSKSLKKLMKKVCAKDITEEMAVADAKVGNIIKVIPHLIRFVENKSISDLKLLYTFIKWSIFF